MRDVVGRVEADEIEQRERPHGIAAAELHSVVDVLDRSHTLFVGADSVEQIRHQQPVHDESGFVAGAQGHFADLLSELVRGVVDVAGRGNRPHDFHQLHQRHGIKEVQADEALRALGRSHQLGDRNG